MTVQLLPINHCMPPHSVSRHNDVIDFANEFATNGWGPGYPNLLGYPWEGKIQLLSGSHRWAAAKMAGLESIPVLVYPYKDIEYAWGNSEHWRLLMRSGEIHEMDKRKD